LRFFPLTVVESTFNEEEGIAPTICELKEVLNDARMIWWIAKGGIEQ